MEEGMKNGDMVVWTRRLNKKAAFVDAVFHGLSGSKCAIIMTPDGTTHSVYLRNIKLKNVQNDKTGECLAYSSQDMALKELEIKRLKAENEVLRKALEMNEAWKDCGIAKSLLEDK